MKRLLGAMIILSALMPSQAADVPITLIRARAVGNSTATAQEVLYVRVLDQTSDQDLKAALLRYAQAQAKKRRLDQITLWVDLESAKDCEKLAGKPYASYSYPAQKFNFGFASRAEYQKVTAELRKKGSCKPLY